MERYSDMKDVSTVDQINSYQIEWGKNICSLARLKQTHKHSGHLA